MKFMIAVLLLVASSAQAQGLRIDRWTPPLPTQAERRAADVASWVSVSTLVALDTKAAWGSSDREDALVKEGCRMFLVYGVTSLVKVSVRRMRPDKSDSLSFYSMHTALAFQARGPRLAVYLPLAAGTGGLRVAAGKHWLTDVLVGAAVGSLTSRIR